MKKLHLMVTVILLPLVSQSVLAQVRQEIHFPELLGYETLKCDFHMHSMFSDGGVWPTVRVNEAWRQGLDAISLTDHIEYQPHEDDVSTDHDRPFELAAGAAKVSDLLFPKGAEITRDTPPGHFNAIFLNDISKLDTEDFLEAIKQANDQGAFVFWNHQAWKGPELGRWMAVHTTLYDNKWLHGMEVCNGETYYPDAHQWCLDKNLTMLGNSDIHEPDLRKQSQPDDHRTMTLVFVQERTLASLKEALVDGRTAVWYKNQLIGRREILEPLFKASVRVEKHHLRSDRDIWVKVRNACELDIALQNTGKLGPGSITLPARSTYLLRIQGAQSDEPIDLSYTATNFLIAPNHTLPVSLRIEGP